MAYEITCNTGGANTAMPKCGGNYGRPIFPILTPPDGSIDTETNALLQATWRTGIENDESSRWYPWPKFYRYTPSREDHVYSQGDFNDKISVREGYGDGIAVYANPPICFQKKLRKFNNQTWKAYWVTDKGYILGTSSDGVKFEPLSVFVHVEEEMPPTADEVRLMQIRIYNTEAYEWEDNGVVIDPRNDAVSTWDPRELEGLLDVTVEISTSSATSVVVDVQSYCDDTPVTGLVLADWTLIDSAGNTETINSSTESTTVDGRYTLDVSTLMADTYDLNLLQPSAMTTEGYQTGSVAQFTVT